MKTRTFLVLISSIFILFFSMCNSNKKLNQVNAETAIKAFLTQNTLKSFIPDRSMTSDNINYFESLNQSSETDASIIGHFNFAPCLYKDDDQLALKFIFRKINEDNKWILTSLKVDDKHNCQNIRNWIDQNQDINIEVK